MNKQKQTYLSPETETLVVRFEGNVMQQASPLYGEQGSAGADLGYNEYGSDF